MAESTRQLSVKELKDAIITVQYICSDSAPKSGYKRMQYYSSVEDLLPGKIYFGLSTRTPINKNTLEDYAVQGSIIKLPNPVVLKFYNDIFLTKENKIVQGKFNKPDEGLEEIIDLNTYKK